MPDEEKPKQPKQDKKLSMYPLSFEYALRGCLASGTPTERGEGINEATAF